MSAPPLRAPFPYYGSKLAAAPLIERLMGPVSNLVIPFAGSLGELLGRSTPAKVETVNDADGLVVNAWRGLVYSPEAMAGLCDHPVHETTMHAAHDLLLARAPELPELLRSDPNAHDVELAAWWVWGASCWLGSGWCREPSEKKPRLGGHVDRPHVGLGVARPWVARPHLSNAGQGVAKPTPHRKIPCIGGPGDGPGRPDMGRGVIAKRQMPMLSGSDGSGVGFGQGVNAGKNRGALEEYFSALAMRLRWVRITCGDWSRVVTPAVTTSHGLTGVSLDPPYCHTLRSTRLYREDSPTLSADVRAWAVERGDDPLLRITLAGKGEEHDDLLEIGWTKHVWRADGETIWASPACGREQSFGPLFG
jgi:hypothetical protein